MSKACFLATIDAIIPSMTVLRSGKAALASVLIVSNVWFMCSPDDKRAPSLRTGPLDE
jgi:hypothetical protein